MNAATHPLKTRLAALRNAPQIKALSLFGPAGQVFELVDLLVQELDRLNESNREQAAAIADLQTRLAGLGALRVKPINGG